MMSISVETYNKLRAKVHEFSLKIETKIKEGIFENKDDIKIELTNGEFTDEVKALLIEV